MRLHLEARRYPVMQPEERTRTRTFNDHQTFAKGRRCLSCGSRMSIYNPGPRCWHHDYSKPTESWDDLMGAV